jgi:hypothetical protein
MNKNYYMIKFFSILFGMNEELPLDLKSVKILIDISKKVKTFVINMVPVPI